VVFLQLNFYEFLLILIHLLKRFFTVIFEIDYQTGQIVMYSYKLFIAGISQAAIKIKNHPAEGVVPHAIIMICGD